MMNPSLLQSNLANVGVPHEVHMLISVLEMEEEILECYKIKKPASKKKSLLVLQKQLKEFT